VSITHCTRASSEFDQIEELLQPAAGAVAPIWGLLPGLWNCADRPLVSDAKLERLRCDAKDELRATQGPLQVRIQTGRTRSRFFTGMTFVFAGTFSSRAVDAMKVLAPHSEKQNKTIAIFVSKFTG
jgi:hypothetical protein